MELKHVLGARRLVQAVDVLGDDRFQLALFFQPGQPQVGRVGLCALYNQLIPVKTVKLLGVLLPERVAQNLLGRVIVFLVVQPVHTAEIRDTALGGNARPAKENNVAALGNDLFEFCYHNKKRPFPGLVLFCTQYSTIWPERKRLFFCGFLQRWCSANSRPS